MHYDPTETAKYRNATNNPKAAKTAGVTLPTRMCHKCGKPSFGTKRVGGAGTRHDPFRWLCVPCIEAAKAKKLSKEAEQKELPDAGTGA